jgi:hypothetical protein
MDRKNFKHRITLQNLLREQKDRLSKRNITKEALEQRMEVEVFQ